MSARACGLIAAICLGLGIGCAAQRAAAQTVVFETSNQHRLELPELSVIRGDCDRIRATLEQIDATDYRTGPRPRNQADQPLFEYERALSQQIVECGQQRGGGRPQMFLQGVPFKRLH